MEWKNVTMFYPTFCDLKRYVVEVHAFKTEWFIIIFKGVRCKCNDRTNLSCMENNRKVKKHVLCKQPPRGRREINSIYFFNTHSRSCCARFIYFYIYITWKGIFNEEKLGWFYPRHILRSLLKILSDISWKMILFQRRFAEKYFYFYIIMCTDESHTQFEQECVWRK